MIVCIAGNRHVPKLVLSNQAVQQHVSVLTMQDIMIKVRAGRCADVHFCDREVAGVPVRFASWMITPRIDHHRYTLRRGYLKGQRPEVDHVCQYVCGGRSVILLHDHLVTARGNLPDV